MLDIQNMTKLGFKVDQATGSSSTCFTPVSGLLQGRSSVSFHKRALDKILFFYCQTYNGYSARPWHEHHRAYHA